jgi:rod shape-determining protein MreB
MRIAALDVGSSQVRIFVPGKGLLLDEPACAVVDERKGHVVAAGHRALSMVGKVPGYLRLVRPIRHGAVDDFAVAAGMLHRLGELAGLSRRTRRTIAVCVSPGATPIERKALAGVCAEALDTDVQLIDRAAACAIGDGVLGAADGIGVMTLDVGGGTAQAAMSCWGGVVSQSLVRCGGRDMDEALRSWFRGSFGLVVGEDVAEELKIRLGHASPTAQMLRAEVLGRDVEDGRPRSVVVSSEEVAGAIEEQIQALEKAVLDCIAAVPPELATDLLADGIRLFGGVAKLAGLQERLESVTSLSVRLAKEPLTAAVAGAAMWMLEAA